MSGAEISDTSAAKRQRFALARRLAGDKRGSAAIEFLFLIFPFTLMMFAVIETGLSFAAQQVISNTTDDIGRSLRVGEIKQADVSQAGMRDLICENIQIMVTQGCPGLSFDLKTYASFSAVPLSIPKTPSGDLNTSGFGAMPGGPRTINQLRVFYRWPVYADFLRKYVGTLPDGKTLLYSTLTWRNEAFDV